MERRGFSGEGEAIASFEDAQAGHNLKAGRLLWSRCYAMKRSIVVIRRGLLFFSLEVLGIINDANN